MNVAPTAPTHDEEAEPQFSDEAYVCWGRMHACRPRPAAEHTPLPARKSDMANISVTDLANASGDTIHLANSNASTKVPGRNRCSPTYRYRSPDRRRAYMAAYMRAYRKRAAVRAVA